MTDAGPFSGLFGWRWPLALAAAALAHLAVLGPFGSPSLADQRTAGTADGAGDHARSTYEIRIAPPAAARGVEEAAADVAAAIQEAGGGGSGGYYAQVRAHLQRHRAAVRTQAADMRTAVVRFRVGADGAVSAVTLMRSSGDPDLDRAALDLLRRASPLPAPPQQRPLTLGVPIEFD